jgi:hypothetical protein
MHLLSIPERLSKDERIILAISSLPLQAYILIAALMTPMNKMRR